MDLGMVIGEKVSHNQIDVSNYNLSIYSRLPLVNQFTPMSFTLSCDATRSQTMLEYNELYTLKWFYKISNYVRIQGL